MCEYGKPKNEKKNEKQLAVRVREVYYFPNVSKVSYRKIALRILKFSRLCSNYKKYEIKTDYGIVIYSSNSLI